jgi:diguanylate cyclase (GGDEF)-like protein
MEVDPVNIVISILISSISILTLSLLPSFNLIRRLPSGLLKKQWLFLVCLIVLFIAGYFLFLKHIWCQEFSLVNIIISIIFFGGSVFVFIVSTLTLSTVKDILLVTALEQQNTKDPLTGVYNRRYLERRLNGEIARSHRYNIPLSILLLDIDHFKNVNDSYGHRIGDLVIQKLAETLMELTRETDFIARYGGDEMVIVLTNTQISGAEVFAERCRKEVYENTQVFLEESDEKPLVKKISISIGISGIVDNIDDITSLIESADRALYDSKENGRNRVTVSRSAYSSV